jgi:hypothetical protein
MEKGDDPFLIKEREELRVNVPDEVFSDLSNKINGYLSEHVVVRKLLVEYNYPLSLEQCLRLSKYFSHDHNMYILILPGATAESNIHELQVNSFCEFNFKVTGETNSNRERFEFFKAYRKGPEMEDEKTVIFTSEQSPIRWTYDFLASFTFERYSYIAVCGNLDVTILWKDKMEVGEEYKASGLVFEIKKDTMKRNQLGKKIIICFLTKVEKARYGISKPTLEKMHGKPMKWFMNSVMYPFHNSMMDYSTLMTLNMFHLWIGFPFNVIITGKANSGKTAVLQKMSVITGEQINTPGSSSVKGFIPSFYENKDAGVLGTSRYKALCNEFFEFLGVLDVYSRRAMLSKLKDTLEGLPVEFISGTGRMKIRQKCDLVAVSNPVHRTRVAREYQDTIELYEDFEPAALDRLLFYQLGREQLDIVTEYQPETDNILSLVGGDLNELDYKDLLNPLELREILAFLKQVKFDLEDWNDLKAMDKEVMACVPVGVFSRRIKFLLNIATAYATIRCLSDGLLTNDAKKVIVKTEDMVKAKDFLINILSKYVKKEKRDRMKQISSLTPDESMIFMELKKTWDNHPDEKYSRRASVTEMGRTFPELMDYMQRLIEKGLIITDSYDFIMYMPDLAPDEKILYAKICEGIQPGTEHETVIAKVLSKYCLINWNTEKSWYSLWQGQGQGQDNGSKLKVYDDKSS